MTTERATLSRGSARIPAEGAAQVSSLKPVSLPAPVLEAIDKQVANRGPGFTRTDWFREAVRVQLCRTTSDPKVLAHARKLGETTGSDQKTK